MQNIFDAKLLRRSPARVKRVRRWIRTLRNSKKYAQGNGYLRLVGVTPSEDNWCCLGVMLDLEWPKGWLDIETAREGLADSTDVAHKLSHEEASTQMPGEAACRAYGLRSTQNASEGGDSLLANWNDQLRPFSEIAEELQTALREALKS